VIPLPYLQYLAAEETQASQAEARKGLADELESKVLGCQLRAYHDRFAVYLADYFR